MTRRQAGGSFPRTGSDHGTQAAGNPTSYQVKAMIERYDRILLAIAVLLAGGWLLGSLTAIPMQAARVASVLAATPFVYDALFRNPPLPAESTHRAAAAIAWLALLAWTLLSTLL